MSKNQNFLIQLFDYSFSNFITIQIIGIVYIIGIIFSGLFSIVSIATSFYQGFWAGILALIVAPLSFLVGTIILRIILESVIVVFRIAQNTSHTAENTKDLRNS
jgi:uncharacterized membrane protein